MQKLSKAVNSDSIRPSIKPIATHKSDNFNHKRITLNTNNSERPNTNHMDCIKEKQTTSLNFSSLQENQIYSSDKDLASSFSFSEDDEKYEEERILFSKFLLSDGSNALTFIRDMNRINRQDLITFVKIGDSETAIKKNTVLAHFIGVWLQSMGYHEYETKKKITMNLQFIFSGEQEIVQIGSKLYESLFHGYIPEYLQLKLLIQVCKRGWEYFSFFIGRYIKLLKRFERIGQEEFIKEVENCLQGKN